MGNSFNSLIDLINKKEEKLVKIMDITKMQSRALYKKDINRLMQETDLKQSVIDEINVLNDEFKEKYNHMIDNHEIDSDDIKQLKERISTIYEVMNSIEKKERDNKKELIRQMDEVRKNISDIKIGKKGMHAYFQKGMQQSSYIDQKK